MKVGIVADNYKVSMFETALKAAGFEWDKAPFTKHCTTIRVTCELPDIPKLHALCAKVQSEAFHKKLGEN